MKTDGESPPKTADWIEDTMKTWKELWKYVWLFLFIKLSVRRMQVNFYYYMPAQ